MRVFRWLADYWVVPLVAAAAVVTWLVSSKASSLTPLAQTKKELGSIKFLRDVRALEIERGAEEARMLVERSYQDRVATLGLNSDLRIKELTDDPVELAKLLEEASR